MTDNRITTWAGQVQELFTTDFKADPLPATTLESLAKTDLVPTSEGSLTFRVFTRAFIRPTRTTLTAFRALGSGTNPMTSDPTNGGQIASTAIPNKYETLTIEKVTYGAYDIDLTSGIDAKENQPEQVVARARAIMAEGIAQDKHELILGQALFSNKWVVPTAANISGALAITAAATTFDISDAEKASSGIAVGDFVKIGANITPNATDGVVETIDVALVKTVGADGSGTGATDSLITIETDTTKFPIGRNSLAPVIFDRLVTSLSAHDLGVQIQIDRPQTASVTTIDNLFIQIEDEASDAFIDMSMLVCYVPNQVQSLMYGTNASGVKSPVVANDILGADVLKKGVKAQGTYRGVQFVADANAMARTEANSTTDLSSARYYIWCFERNESVAYQSALESTAMDNLPGRGGLLKKLSWVMIHDSMMPRAGKIRSFLMPVNIS